MAISIQKSFLCCILNHELQSLSCLIFQCPLLFHLLYFVVVQSRSHVRLFVNPRTAAHQAPLSSTISWSVFKFMSIELVMSSNHFILCCPLLLLPSIFPIISVFSNELALRIRWWKYWSFSFSIGFPSNIQG